MNLSGFSGGKKRCIDWRGRSNREGYLDRTGCRNGHSKTRCFSSPTAWDEQCGHSLAERGNAGERSTPSINLHSVSGTHQGQVIWGGGEGECGYGCGLVPKVRVPSMHHGRNRRHIAPHRLYNVAQQPMALQASSLALAFGSADDRAQSSESFWAAAASSLHPLRSVLVLSELTDASTATLIVRSLQERRGTSVESAFSDTIDRGHRERPSVGVTS